MPEPPDLAVLELVPDGVLLSDRAGRIVYANRRAEAMTGYSRDQLLGQAVELLVPVGLRAAHRKDRRRYTAHPRARTMGSVDRDFHVLRRDGTQFSAEISLGPVQTAAGTYVMSVIRDETERVKLESALARQALHDPLTGLANRTLFFDRLKQAMLQANRDRKQVALVMLDLDQFKAVNDVFGHQTGDHVLRKVSARLSGGLRSTDTFARIGGDEFAWLLPSVSGRHAAEIIVAKVLRSVPAHFLVDRKTINVGVSAGMALYPDDGKDADSLMRVADVELYAAKRQAAIAPRRRPRG